MARTYETDDELRELVRVCDEGGIAKECQTCGRSFAICRQYGDLPMRMRKEMPICSACYEPRRTKGNGGRHNRMGQDNDATGGADTMGKRINWMKPQAGSKVPLYLELLEMREAGLTLAEISKQLRERHQIEVDSGALRKALERYAEGKPPERSNDQVAWAEPMPGQEQALWKEAEGLKKGGRTWKGVAEELQSRYGISVVPGTVSGMVGYYAKRAGEGERQQPNASPVAKAMGDRENAGKQQGHEMAPAAAVEQRDGAPCLFHIARDGFEVWITGRDENEFLVKVQQARNLMELAGNV